MRSGAKVAIVGGVFIMVAGGVGYGAYQVLGGGGDGDDGTEARSASAEIRTGPPGADEIADTAAEFLAAWADGKDPERAAAYTNNPDAAKAAVASYAEEAHITGAVITPGKATGATVPFTVKATVTYEGVSKPLAYASELTVVRGLTTGKPLVDWLPTVVHPKLTKTSRLVTGEAATPPIKALDRDGRELTAEKYPSLAPVLDQLRDKYGEKAGGKPGVETWIEDDDEKLPRTTLVTLAKGRSGELRTTLDARVQAAAETAVKKYPQASVAAVKPSTGEIIAVANNREDGFNAAMLGKQAPGSTMKIVTAAMLLEKGLVGADRPAECPKTVLYQGTSFHNLKNFEIQDGTFTQSFARSCNTAFIKLIDDTGDDHALPAEAREVFGLGLNWQTGIPSADGSVPEADGGGAAAQYIGQGTVQMNVLNIASVTATAKDGRFRQPIIVPRQLDNRQLAYAQRQLPQSVGQALREMMRQTAAWGTGRAAMAGLGGDKGAKTGSAEVDGQATSNSWFTGFQDDLAAAASVESGGHGGDAAGPVVAAVLAAG
ncbi:penicillin-binding transpeptidase domain-containing protein [Streptomyces sp. NBC_01498]|uniref:penicillin-binding transpeptidase domain-containing protein n=1 Tax=Streptomyces sp. NBC_01498 TaxID=2975870 RepID=UPI002E7B1A80|nr:penicillin-binding transpeptidase domain-containing protein [Streptomyces sp. NBC_01498]WTL26413.1 penicillin-binding transpeptidase domain-containing protein [Streptomyces sp. NBC_01498]